MAIGDSDLGIFFGGDWNTAVFNGQSFGCHLDYPENLDSLLGVRTPVVSGKPSIRYATASAPGLKSGDALTVDGVAYVVRESKKEADGKVSVANLREA